MKHVLLLYGLQGSDAPHWQSWLKNELESTQKYHVYFPQLTNNTNPQKDIWIEEVMHIMLEHKIDTVITHSLGNILWFHLCNDSRFKTLHVNTLLLVAPPRDLRDMKAVESFFPYTIPSTLHANTILMVGSDNDPYMNTNELEALSNALHVKHTIISNAGHINASSGYGAWPWIKEWILTN